MLDYGLPPARPGVAVELRALDKVIDFPARDMTITVEAGITIARLDEITRAEGLHLPIDVPDPERATLGGAIACNVSGPRRYGYGTFRDYMLGITTVNDRGEEVSAGGRVVKNVAGYDLMKLHTGAMGTLGVITQVTLKLRPVPEADRRDRRRIRAGHQAHDIPGRSPCDENSSGFGCRVSTQWARPRVAGRSGRDKMGLVGSDQFRGDW